MRRFFSPVFSCRQNGFTTEDERDRSVDKQADGLVKMLGNGGKDRWERSLVLRLILLWKKFFLVLCSGVCLYFGLCVFCIHIHIRIFLFICPIFSLFLYLHIYLSIYLYRRQGKINIIIKESTIPEANNG